MGSGMCWMSPQLLCGLCAACGTPSKLFSRVAYVFIHVLCLAVSLFILFFGSQYITYASWFVDCPDGSELSKCMAISAIYRMSFCLAVFHFLMFLLCLCGGPMISALNEGIWLVKIAFIALLALLTFFLPGQFFVYYAYFSVWASFIFLVYEMILLIDLAYVWNQNWVDYYDSSAGGTQCCWMIIIITSTFVVFGGACTVFFYLYSYFREQQEIIIISVTVIAGVIYFGISMSPLVERGSLLTNSFILLFSSLLCASAILSDYYENTNTKYLQIGLGLFFTFLVLFYAGGTTKTPPAQEVQISGRRALGQPVVSAISGTVMETDPKYQEQIRNSRDLQGVNNEDLAIEAEVNLNTAIFHLLLTFASIYYAVVLTNWGTLYGEAIGQSSGVAPTWVPKTVKLSALGAVTLLYIWSLIAPRICPDRDFS